MEDQADRPALLGVFTEEEMEAVQPGGSMLPVSAAGVLPQAARPYVRAALLRSLLTHGHLVAVPDGVERVDEPHPSDPSEERDEPDAADEPDDVTEQGLAYLWPPGEEDPDGQGILVAPDSPLALILRARAVSRRGVVVEVRQPGWSSAMSYLGGDDDLWVEESVLPDAVRRFALHRLDALVAGLLPALGLAPDGGAPPGGLDGVLARLREMDRATDETLTGPGADEVTQVLASTLHLVTVVQRDVVSGAGTIVTVAHSADAGVVVIGPAGPGRVLAGLAAGLDHEAWLRAAFSGQLSALATGAPARS